MAGGPRDIYIIGDSMSILSLRETSERKRHSKREFGGGGGGRGNLPSGSSPSTRGLVCLFIMLDFAGSGDIFMHCHFRELVCDAQGRLEQRFTSDRQSAYMRV